MTKHIFAGYSFSSSFVPVNLVLYDINNTVSNRQGKWDNKEGYKTKV